MFAQTVGLFPSDIPVEDHLSSLLDVHDPTMMRLLGIASEHASHLYEIGAGELAGTLRLIESLGASMAHLALAHTIHLSSQVTSAGDASRTTAAAIGPLYDNLAKHLSLASRARFGASLRGDRNQPTPAVLQTITAQVMGAYTICAGYASLRRLVAEHFDETREETPAAYDFKTALQLYTQSVGRGQPRYTLLAETGPAHAKTFTAQVNTDNERAAKGTGTTKKAAEQHAAQQYLAQYAPRFVQHVPPPCNRPYPRTAKPTARQAIAKNRENSLQDLSQQLNLGRNAIPLLDAALTHSSYHSQHPEAPDNTLLAHLGSHVIDSLASYQLMSTLLRPSNRQAREGDSRKVIAKVVAKNNGHLEQACEILHLAPLLVVGNAIKQIIPPMKVEAFQAVMGATLLARACPTIMTDLLPQRLLHWLDQAIRQEHPTIGEEQQATLEEQQAKTPHANRPETATASSGTVAAARRASREDPSLLSGMRRQGSGRLHGTPLLELPPAGQSNKIIAGDYTPAALHSASARNMGHTTGCRALPQRRA